NVIGEMRARYSIAVGYSDHTMGVAAPFAAAALGASVIEKHFTFSQLMYGSDARHSMEPGEFKCMCVGLREIWQMLEREVDKDDLGTYADMRRVFQKSIVSARDIDEGEVLSLGDLAFKKPGDGIPAADANRVIGQRAAHAISKNMKILESDLK
ncbi:MAG: N-acetylneuraminate synthase family protein, partial [Rhodospirillales bacterium]